MKRKMEPFKGSIDFKSLVIGLLLGLCITLVLGASNYNDNGQYQCSAGGSQVFVIDTQTGQTWALDHSSTTDFGTPQNRKSQKSFTTPISK